MPAFSKQHRLHRYKLADPTILVEIPTISSEMLKPNNVSWGGFEKPAREIETLGANFSLSNLLQQPEPETTISCNLKIIEETFQGLVANIRWVSERESSASKWVFGVRIAVPEDQLVPFRWAMRKLISLKIFNLRSYIDNCFWWLNLGFCVSRLWFDLLTILIIVSIGVASAFAFILEFSKNGLSGDFTLSFLGIILTCVSTVVVIRGKKRKSNVYSRLAEVKNYWDSNASDPYLQKYIRFIETELKRTERNILLIKAFVSEVKALFYGGRIPLHEHILSVCVTNQQEDELVLEHCLASAMPTSLYAKWWSYAKYFINQLSDN